MDLSYRKFPGTKVCHRAIRVYSHFSIFGHRARHKLISWEGAHPPPQAPPARLATSLDTDLKLFSGEGAQPDPVTGTFIPRNFRSQERKFHRWNFRSLELSFTGIFVP